MFDFDYFSQYELRRARVVFGLYSLTGVIDLEIEPIYPDHRIRPQKLRQNSSRNWQVLTCIEIRLDLIIADSESLSPPPFLADLRDI